MEFAYKLVILVYLGIFPSHTVFSKSTKKCCVFNDNGRCESFKISCKKGSLIYKPKLEAGTGNCQNTSCYAMTPNLIVEKNNCQWKNKCSINFPVEPFVTDCFGQVPECLNIKGWRCLDQKKKGKKQFLLRDICDKDNSTGGFQGQGIIRSHKDYPWDYDQTLLNRTCSQNFYPKDNGKQMLIVTIDDLDIDRECDYLTIVAKNTNTRRFAAVAKTFVFHPRETVTFKFSTNMTNRSKAGRGFILCFKFVNRKKNAKKWKSKNVCDSITTDGLKMSKRKPKYLGCMNGKGKTVPPKRWFKQCGNEFC